MKLITKILKLFGKLFHKKSLYIIQLNTEKILLSKANKQDNKPSLTTVITHNLNHNEITPKSLVNLTAINQVLSFHINKGDSIRHKIIVSLPFIKDMNNDRKKLIFLQTMLAVSKHGFIIEKMVTTPLINAENNASKNSKTDSYPLLQRFTQIKNELTAFLPEKYQIARLWIALTIVNTLFSLSFVVFSYKSVMTTNNNLDEACSKLSGLHKEVPEIVKKRQAAQNDQIKLTNTINKLSKQKDTSGVYLQLIISIAKKMPDNSRLETLSVISNTKNKKNKHFLLTLNGITRNPEEINDLIRGLLEKYPAADFSLENIERAKKQSKRKNQQFIDYSFVVKGTIKI